MYVPSATQPPNEPGGPETERERERRNARLFQLSKWFLKEREGETDLITGYDHIKEVIRCLYSLFYLTLPVSPTLKGETLWLF